MTRLPASISTDGVSPETEVLHHLLSRADFADAAFDYDEARRRWPRGLRDRFIEIGLLQELLPRGGITCDGCADNHWLTVDIREYPCGIRGISKCPECGRVEVSLDRLRWWSVDYDMLAAMVKRESGASGHLTTIVPGRIWMLGYLLKDGLRRELFLARMLSRPDAPDVIEACDALHVAESPVLITYEKYPQGIDWPLRRPIIHTLLDLASFEDGELYLNLDLLLAVPAHAWKSTAWLSVTEAGKHLLNDVSGIELKQAKARVSKAAGKGKFKTNGKSGLERRIDRDSFNTWRMAQRERDLEAVDQW